jgi:sigma-B regulation protein RsbU (phosphoserine phosphatase)
MQGEQYPEETCGPLTPGSVILASTDGVWEAQNETNEQFGKERIRETLREHAHRSAGDIARAVHDRVQAFCGDARQLDDITFVVARRVEPAGG